MSLTLPGSDGLMTQSGHSLDLFGDVFRLLIDLDAVELGPIAGDSGGVARV